MYPCKPQFYYMKVGFKNIDYWYTLEPPRWGGGSNEYPQYPQSMFWAEIWKISDFFIRKLSVFGGEAVNIFE